MLHRDGRSPIIVGKAAQIGFSDLKFTFDHRRGAGNTSVLYDWMTSQPEWDESGIFFANEISFSSRQNPRIQIADLVARETMKGLGNIIGPRRRPMRKSLIALATTDNRLEFDYLMREYFEDMKKKLEQSIKKGEGEYLDWLQKNKIQDNINSRHRFLIWQDAEKLRHRQ
jgi:hypothetical protein